MVGDPESYQILTFGEQQKAISPFKNFYSNTN